VVNWFAELVLLVAFQPVVSVSELVCCGGFLGTVEIKATLV
jgi:hypothetical protein